MNLRLDGKNAIVCGSSQGLGKAIALRFSEMGVNVVLLSRNENSLKKVLKELHNNGKQSHGYIQVDFSEPDKAIEKIKNETPSEKIYHILVNNSGGPAPGAINTANTGNFRAAFNQHVIMSQLLTQYVIPGMKKR